VLDSRISELEDSEVIQRRYEAMTVNDVRSITDKTLFVEREGAHLSQVCATLEKHVLAQERMFESEQLYRRGCGAFAGTNILGRNGTRGCPISIRAMHSFR
jgi:hypothetical protein